LDKCDLFLSRVIVERFAYAREPIARVEE